MSVQCHTTPEGPVWYRARVKHHGREVATRVFDRKRDAEAWEEEQKRRLRWGEWFDPRRGRVALSVVAADWPDSRRTIKRNSLAFAVQDGRVMVNVAAAVKAPTAGYAKREGQYLTHDEIGALANACTGEYADVV
jgi:hypothetical protein